MRRVIARYLYVPLFMLGGLAMLIVAIRIAAWDGDSDHNARGGDPDRLHSATIERLVLPWTGYG